MNGEKKKYTFTRVMLRVIPISFKTTPVLSIVVILMGILHALTWAVGIIATQNLFDAVSNAAAGYIGIGECIMSLLILTAVTFGQQVMNGVHNFVGVGIAIPKSLRGVKTMLHRKLQRIDPSRFEETSFLDDLNKAREGIAVIPLFSQLIFLIVCFYGVYFGSIGIYLYRLKPILVITLVVAFIPALLAQIVRGKVFTKLEEQNAPLRREYEYYQKTICDREYFKETRLLGAFDFFHKLFSDTMLLLTRKTWQAERKTALLQLLLNITSFAGMAISAYMLFTATMSGEITVGAFAAVFAALGNIFSIMQEIINMHIGSMNRDIGKITNFVRMLDIPEWTGTEKTPDFSKGIVAQNISFTYPGRDEPAVRDVSLTIAEGETIAIVGENGAGKSTLVRLLTGIYHPSDGKVTVGGLDTARFAPKSVYKGISGVFQKYQRYKMTLKDNVAISDMESTGTERLDTALHDADFNSESAGPDTMLSPEFDGIDLSGGQWQRLAIARGLYRQNGFIVLDEPTSAIDPIEETKIYTQFQHLASGKCAVVVTHRLGSAKLAHRIVVMDGGRIIDTGTHNELVARPGKYADMWMAQAKWYERGSSQ